MKPWLAIMIFITGISINAWGHADESIKYVPIMFSDLTIIIPVEPSSLPPDPGDLADTTIAGIDANANGIRDDIERYIAYGYPGDNNATLRDRL